MRKLFFYLLVLLTFSAISAFAGAGHDHGPASQHDQGPASPISETQALERANVVVDKLVEKEKLESSWSEAKCVGAEKKEGKTGPEWVVTFNNANVKDAEKQNLYVFFSETGKYLAANFVGLE